MKKISIIALLLANSLITAYANAKEITPPQIVGPEIYELYTDARFFITHVYVNGDKRKLSNAEGNSSIRKRGLSFSGAAGYRNKTLVNVGLKHGHNTIKVVFEPTPGLEKQKEQEGKNTIIRDMFAHAILTKGILNHGSLGVKSYELDILVKNKNSKIKIIGNTLLRRFKKEQLSKEVSITFDLNIPTTANIAKTEVKECEIDFNTSTNLTAKISLNGSAIRKIENRTGRIEGVFHKLVKKGQNTLKVEVASINKKMEPSFIETYLSCDIEDAIKKAAFSKEHRRLSFTDFFTRKRSTISRTEITKKGVYTSNFDFSF